MALRCSFCGTWNNRTAESCHDCGESLVKAGGAWRRLTRAAVMLGGGALSAATLMPVIRPFTDPRAVLDVPSAVLFVIGLALVLAGIVRR